MRTIFIAYSEDARRHAEGLAAKLGAKGHRVFFDKSSLPPGAGYDERIREAVAQADLMVFFISKRSTRPPSSDEGSYALTELGWAKEKWSNPEGRILPVVVDPDPTIKVPEYLKATVTAYQPEGNVATEVAVKVTRLLEALDAAPDPRVETTEPRALDSSSGKTRTTATDRAMWGLVVLFMAGMFGWFFFKDWRMKSCVSTRLEASHIDASQAELVASRSTRSEDTASFIRSASEPNLFRLMAQPPAFKAVADCALEHERNPPVLVFNSPIRVETEQRSPVSQAIVRLQEVQCTTDATGSCTLSSELRVEPGQTLTLTVTHAAFQPRVEQHLATALGQSPVVVFLKEAAGIDAR